MEKDLIEIHKEALFEFEKIQTQEHDIRRECLRDRRICSVYGASYEDDTRSDYGIDSNTPKYEFNKIYLACIRITNEYRNNRIDVSFLPRDQPGGQALADACADMLRADEQDCCAQEAYDNAFDEGLKGGFGAWKLCNEYEDDEDENDDYQCVKIEPIYDAESSVFFDLGATRQDKSDAKRCYVVKPMAIEDARDAGYDTSPINKNIYSNGWNWYDKSKDILYIAEYYKCDEKKEVVRFFGSLTGNKEDEVRVTEHMINNDENLLSDLEMKGYRELRRKKVTRKIVRKYIMSGSRIEEDCGEVPGGVIPVVPFYGNRSMIESVEHYHGHGRMARDAMSIFNASLSWVMDIASRSTTSVPILTPEQVIGHENQWDNAPVTRPTFLLLNNTLDAAGMPTKTGPLEYTRPPEVPPAMAAMIQTAAQTLDELLGNQQAGEQLQPNMSGKAVELVQNRLDMQTYIYISNLQKAMKRSGEIWLRMKKALCVENGRSVKAIDKDGKQKYLKLNEEGLDEKTGSPIKNNNLTAADFDVSVTFGPSTVSKRAAVVRAVTGLLQMVQDPETQQVLTHAAIANIEGEGLGSISEWSRKKMVQMGAETPNDEDKKEMDAMRTNQKPDPQAVFLENEALRSAALAEKAKADTVKTLVDAQAKSQELGIAMQQAVSQIQQPTNAGQILGNNAPSLPQ
jgi:Phage P22-like portal protein